MMVWVKRGLLLLIVLAILVLFIVIPVGGSFLITNSRFGVVEDDALDPGSVGLLVERVEFTSADGVNVQGWWDTGEPGSPFVVFSHGLNRSRLELLARAGATRQHGFGVLLLDLRNHGASGNAHTTLGIDEAMDVCAASDFVSRQTPARRKVFWGVSLGASTSVLAAARCGADAVVSDSAFLSFESTVEHHLRLIFGLPKFPAASLLIFLTRTRMGFELGDGDVESTVRKLPEIPMLFIAGSEDVRMPPDIAARLFQASANPRSETLVVEGAGHGHAFERDPSLYMDTVFTFLQRALPPV